LPAAVQEFADYKFGVAAKGIITIPNFVKHEELAQKLKGRTHTDSTVILRTYVFSLRKKIRLRNAKNSLQGIQVRRR
jgi:DNA-binding response OmpR family regulator